MWKESCHHRCHVSGLLCLETYTRSHTGDPKPECSIQCLLITVFLVDIKRALFPCRHREHDYCVACQKNNNKTREYYDIDITCGFYKCGASNPNFEAPLNLTTAVNGLNKVNESVDW